MKKQTTGSSAFYIYKWDSEFTTFVIADSPQNALDVIEECRGIACPPELQNEKLLKKNLTKSGPNFILTVSSPEETDSSFESDESVDKKDSLN
jgi:hypothetical protein